MDSTLMPDSCIRTQTSVGFTNRQKLFNREHTKGQKISKWKYEVVALPKIWTKDFEKFCHKYSGQNFSKLLFKFWTIWTSYFLFEISWPLYRNHAGRHLYGTENIIWAGFGLIGNTEKKIWTDYEQLFGAFFLKIL